MVVFFVRVRMAGFVQVLGLRVVLMRVVVIGLL